jgi:sugar (pentulose or hexulose) kinase
MDYLAGIDLGSTSLKCVIYDLDGNVVASGTRPTQRFNPYPDHPEWTVWQRAMVAQRRCRGSCPQKSRNIKAVAVTGHGNGWCSDRRGGELALPIY